MHKSNNSISESLGNSTMASSKKNSDSVKAPSFDDISAKKCAVCQKGFMLRRKITCQVCLNVFCSDHCTRKRKLDSGDDPLPICDPCNEEETKREIDQEIDSEIQTLTAELSSMKENNERLFKEHYTNAAALNNLDMEIKKQEWNNKRQEDDLLFQLESEQNRGLKLRNQVDVMRKSLDELSRSEKAMCDQCLQAENELQSLQIFIQALEEQKGDVLGQTERLQAQLRESLSLEQIRRILCEKCLMLVNKNLQGKVMEEKDDREENEKEDFQSLSMASQETDKPTKGCVVF